MPNKYSAYNKQWKLLNKERETENCKKWHEENREHRRAYRRALYAKEKTNPDFKLKKILRNRFSKLIKGKAKQQSILKYVGCSVEELKNHLESQFKDSMSWENHGKVWHVDHIIPLCNFDHGNEIEIYKAWNYNNLQPLFVKDNLLKGSKT